MNVKTKIIDIMDKIDGMNIIGVHTVNFVNNVHNKFHVETSRRSDSVCSINHPQPAEKYQKTADTFYNYRAFATTTPVQVSLDYFAESPR